MSVVSDVHHVNEYVSDDHSNIIFGMINNLIKCNIPIERYLYDKSKVNGYGKKFLETCKNNMVCIFNGRVGDDLRIGKADYIIDSPVLLTMVQASKV
ncbi:hypothetical protein E2C01_014530 [Portunus trituberculatus]|uniref:Uncharacterized protein n=1 Tax=Portunus trituberculatus TaxID=210409 RepID=A0A5B7DJ37_PORTR|nr:hypothetical protein [Portunus trituberculatus]